MVKLFLTLEKNGLDTGVHFRMRKKFLMFLVPVSEQIVVFVRMLVSIANETSFFMYISTIFITVI